MKPVNFYAGPAILPEEVLKQAQEAIKDFAGTGLSILEVSHRSSAFIKVMEEARALVRELMQLNSDREVIFLHGGGLSQFHMVPMNLLNEDETASYFDTGTWARGAVEEAKLFGNVHIACSSRESNYNHIPKEFSIAPYSKYLHVTSNNTIYGTQLVLTPGFASKAGGRNILSKYRGSLVCDMSSDIFSRQVNYNQFNLIYAAAQKNIGAAGVTLVVVDRNILNTVRRKIPRMLDYRLHIEKESMLNTPSVFAVYVATLLLRWTKQQGLKSIEERNERKAKKLYEVIDASKIFIGTVPKEDRSKMNVCFVMKDKALEEKFSVYATQNNIVGIKGHRTVGGFRVSIYNSMPESGVDTLVEVMKEFERTL